MPILQFASNRYFITIPKAVIKQANWKRGIELFFNFHTIENTPIVVINSVKSEHDGKVVEELIKIYKGR